jgi:hypothetical protein
MMMMMMMMMLMMMMMMTVVVMMMMMMMMMMMCVCLPTGEVEVSVVDGVSVHVDGALEALVAHRQAVQERSLPAARRTAIHITTAPSPQLGTSLLGGGGGGGGGGP